MSNGTDHGDKPDLPTGGNSNRVPAVFFWLELSYLVLLLASAVLFAQWGRFNRTLPHEIGPVPLSVAWWGALGAVVISLEGVFVHSRNWNPAYNNWHIARPLVGAALGTVAFLMYILIIDAAGAKAPPRGRIAYFVIAFLVGYREETFRSLIKTRHRPSHRSRSLEVSGKESS